MTEPAPEESDAPVLKGKDGGCARHAQAHRQVERARPLRPSLVSHHRPAGRRQDDGARQFRAEVSARGRQCGQGRSGRRRNALLRLVVYRRGGADRHRRALHDPGFGRQGRSQELARLPRDAAQQPPAPADQRRHRGDQHRRCSQPAGRGGGRARRRDPQAPRRTARGAQGRFSGLRGLHQDGSRSSASPNISPISTRTSVRSSGARRSRPPTRKPTTSARFRRRWISSFSASRSG